MLPAALIQVLTRAIGAATRLLGREKGPEHLRVGREGEDEAYFFLRKHGYTIIARNWRTRRRKGEIDLIGWDGPTLCVIEVKTRSSRDIKPAEAAVDRSKQRELALMSREFLRGRSNRSCRFDVISVYREEGTAPDVQLFKDAFRWRSMGAGRERF